MPVSEILTALLARACFMSLPHQTDVQLADDFLWEAVMPPPVPEPYFEDRKHGVRLYQGDALSLLARAKDGIFDLIFADPPYFLSNDGITCHAGKMVSVNKGVWDRAETFEAVYQFNELTFSFSQVAVGIIWVGSAVGRRQQSTWVEIVSTALTELGGEAHLKDINRVVMLNPRTKKNQTWPSTIRRVVRQSHVFEAVGRGRYRLRQHTTSH